MESIEQSRIAYLILKICEQFRNEGKTSITRGELMTIFEIVPRAEDFEFIIELTDEFLANKDQIYAMLSPNLNKTND